MTKSRSVDQKLDALFQAPLAEFISTRKELVTALRKQAQAGPAAALQAIKKPSVSAWAVNQLFFRESALWAKLQAAGSAVRHAYGTMGQGGAGDGVRKAQKELGRALDELRSKARGILQTSGQKASEGMLRRIGTTLHALVAREPDDEITAGRLVADVDPPGFEALSWALGGLPKAGATPAAATKAKAEKAPAAGPHRAVKEKPEPVPPKRRALKEKPEPTPPKHRDVKEKLASTRAREQKEAHARAAQQEHERLAKQRKLAALHKAQRELATQTRVLAGATRKLTAAKKALTTAEAAHTKAAHAHESAQQAVEQAQSAVAKT